MSESTEIIHWRGGPIEFGDGAFEFLKARNPREFVCSPPWWVIEISGGPWGDRTWYLWIDYQGPPQVYLTRKRALERARAFRNQYCEKGLKVHVRKIGVLP